MSFKRHLLYNQCIIYKVITLDTHMLYIHAGCLENTF